MSRTEDCAHSEAPGLNYGFGGIYRSGSRIGTVEDGRVADPVRLPDFRRPHSVRHGKPSPVAADGANRAENGPSRPKSRNGTRRAPSSDDGPKPLTGVFL